MKFGKIYRDVVSLLKAERKDHANIYSQDIVGAINDSIATQRQKQIRAGIKTPFTIESEIHFNFEDRNVSYLNKSSLEKPPIREIPLSESVVTAIAKRTPNTLKEATKSWTEGDKVVKGKYLYEAVSDVPAINSYDLAFDIADYVPYGKGVLFAEGDAIYVSQDQTVWRATSDFVGSGDVSADPTEQLYWKKLGRAEIDASILPYENKRDLRVLDVSITISKKKIFTTPDIGFLFLEYIPVWEPVESLEKEIDLPISILQIVKQDALQRLSPKLRTSQQSTGENE